MKCIKILIVEDEIEFANLLQTALQFTFGMHTAIAVCKTAETALRRLGEESFDLLIADWFLPGMSGLSLILRARKHFPTLRIIFMANSPVAEIEDRVKQIADIYVVKPFGALLLAEEIQGLFQVFDKEVAINRNEDHDSRR